MLAIQKANKGFRVFGVADEDCVIIGNGFIKAIPANAKIVTFINGVCPHIIPVRKAKKDERSDFALPDQQMYPLNGADHVHSAIVLFSRHDWSKTGGKKEAAKRILAAAKRHGIEVSAASDVARAARGK